MRVIKYIAWILVGLVAFVCTTWAFGALYFDFPRVGTFAAILFVIALLAIVIFVRGKLLKLAIVFAAFAVVVFWWLTLKPSNDEAWQPDVAQTAWAEIMQQGAKPQDAADKAFKRVEEIFAKYPISQA